MLYEVLKQLNQLLESIKSAELIWSLSLLIVRLLVHAIDVLEYRRGKKKKKKKSSQLLRSLHFLFQPVH